MNLGDFFDPVEIETDNQLDSFESAIYVNRNNELDIEKIQIALIGLNECRGSHSQIHHQSPDQIRTKLYNLKKGYGNYAILDLGNLKNGITLEDTYQKIKKVGSYLMRKNITPIYFGGSHDLDLGQYFSYAETKKMISVVNIDNKMDIHPNSIPDLSHIYNIFVHSPNYLFHYCQLAYQSYITSIQDIQLIEELSFESVRLGQIKEDIQVVEPYIREANMITFDLSAIQSVYAPASSDSTIFGLTGEEACQLCWYAGQNENLSSIGFYNYDSEKDSTDKKNAFVLGTMIWYFIEGYYHRKNDTNFKKNNYLLYEVHFDRQPETIRFYKSKQSDRWWMVVPSQNNKSELYGRSRIVPCHHQDYKKALQGELPDRWVHFFTK